MEESVFWGLVPGNTLKNTGSKPKTEVKNELPVAAPSASRLPFAEVSKRGREIYETLRTEMEKRYHGEYLLIDIETGESVHAPNLRAAHALMDAINPKAIPYCIRIGYKSVIKT